jgi:hypothetical protein
MTATAAEVVDHLARILVDRADRTLTFDYRIFVQSSFEVAEGRGVARDHQSLGGIEEARRLYRQRYHEAQRIYFREAEPLKYAYALLVNDDVAHPVLFIRTDPPRSATSGTDQEQTDAGSRRRVERRSHVAVLHLPPTLLIDRGLIFFFTSMCSVS